MSLSVKRSTANLGCLTKEVTRTHVKDSSMSISVFPHLSCIPSQGTSTIDNVCVHEP